MKPRHHSTEAEDIKTGIEQTRARMDGTLDQLTERLKPRHILDDVLDYFHSRRNDGSHDSEKLHEAAAYAKNTAADAGRVVVRQVKQHPVPSLLIGAGLAWLLFESTDEEQSGEGYAKLYSEDAAEIYYERQGGHPESLKPEMIQGNADGDGDESSGMMGSLKNRGAHLKEKGSELTSQAGEKMRQARRMTAQKAGQVRARASELTSQVADQTQELYATGVDTFKRTADEHPLATAAGFLALGVIAGMLLPSTRKEDEIVGPTRDRLVRKSQQAAEDVVERGKRAAQSVTEAAKREAEEQGLTPSALKESGSHIVATVKEAARQEGLTPSALKEKTQSVAAEAKETARQEGQHAAEPMKAEG